MEGEGFDRFVVLEGQKPCRGTLGIGEEDLLDLLGGDEDLVIIGQERVGGRVGTGSEDDRSHGHEENQTESVKGRLDHGGSSRKRGEAGLLTGIHYQLWAGQGQGGIGMDPILM